MTGPAPRLKTCVLCGAILQAADPVCSACRAPQPGDGERPVPRAGAARSSTTGGATGAHEDSLLRRAALPAVVVALLVAAALGLNAARLRLAHGGSGGSHGGDGGHSGAAAGAAGATVIDAARIAVVEREAEGDGFDWAAPDGLPPVELDLERVLEYYPIEGTTTAQIFTAIDERGPDGRDGRAVGLTRLQSGTYLYVRDERSGRCAVTQLGATLTITLPRLTTRSLPEPVYERWQDYVRAVSEHEQRHADIYAEAVRRVAERLRSLQPFADRGAMEAGFDAAWTEHMDVAERRNREFHRREAQDVALERELVTNELVRVERELETVAARLEARARRHPDLRLPPAEYEQHEIDRLRYDALLAQRTGLIERGLWLH